MSELFYQQEGGGYFETVKASIKDEIQALPENQLVASSEEEIIDYIFSKYEIIPLQIYEDKMFAQHEDTKVIYRAYEYKEEYDGLKFNVRLPFTGDAELWYTRPSTWTTTFPEGSIQSDKEGRGVLVFDVVVMLDQDPNTSNKHIEENLKSIRFYLDKQRGDVERFNNNIKNIAGEPINVRKSNLEKKAAVIDAFKISLRKSAEAPDISLIPVKRKLIKPLSPVPDQRTEYGISEDDYEQVLKVIRHQGRSFEITPATYAVHDEEDLRNILVGHLNLYFPGTSGETFRKSGKTDILIEDVSHERAAFVAECKVWRGPSELNEAIDQLLGYLTWRDCKTAIIIFNKAVSGFTTIQMKIPTIFESHSKYGRTINAGQAGEWRFICCAKEDLEREVTVHVFLFNVYV
ncbi:MAG TPA: hypothetical protein VMX13_11350 [Sedimentisphaerales bacterium]|nr:hypothetical protein [Sedimentisphaerales bacterium]